MYDPFPGDLVHINHNAAQLFYSLTGHLIDVGFYVICASDVTLIRCCGSVKHVSAEISQVRYALRLLCCR